MIWCPKCSYHLPKGKFYQNRCPQCRTIINDGEALTTDPYKPSRKGTRKEKENSKKFEFDNKPKDPLQSIPTDTLNLYKRDK